MRVLVTGNLGYIGTILVPMLVRAGHEVVGLDSNLYSRCTYAPGGGICDVKTIRKDVRDAVVEDESRPHRRHVAHGAEGATMRRCTIPRVPSIFAGSRAAAHRRTATWLRSRNPWRSGSRVRPSP